MPREVRRRVCFVTGTRAEFGLMASTLRALRDHAAIELQLVATGTHTHAERGRTLAAMRQAGWRVDAVVAWRDESGPSAIARATGLATARLADVLARLDPHFVLVVGDRVEAFAAASAAHIGGRIVAHVHGGDRALGQVDDALRHAISKLAHLHFAATRASGERLFAMGEDRRRIRVVGAPGIDGIRRDADSGPPDTARPASEFVLALLHPTSADDAVERDRADLLIASARRAFGGRVIALMPNSDPGSPGIAEALRRRAALGDVSLVTHLERPRFLAMMRDCRALIGNSSSGIIEAGSFGTPVVDVGPRQLGRERGPNVMRVDWRSPARLAATIARALAVGRFPQADNPYDRGGAGRRIARVLAHVAIDERLRRKLIRY